MKKIRILLVNNPLTSLFMAAWFKQSCRQNKDEWRTVGVYCSQDFDESYSADIENKKSIYKEACLAPLKVMVDKWVDCMPSRYPPYGISIRKPFKMMNERISRKKELKFIRDTMRKNNISLQHVKEIWYGNSSFNPHFFYLYPTAGGFQFEHGFSEVKNELNYQVQSEIAEEFGHLNGQYFKLLKTTKKWLIRQIYKRCIYFTYEIIQRGVYLSILGDEIRTAKSENFKVNGIETQEVKSIIQSVIKSDPSYTFLKELKGNTALILLMHLRPKPWGKKEVVELLDYFDRFETYLSEDLKETFQKYQIKNIIFKSRFFHEEYSEEGFTRFSKLSKLYNLIFLSSYSETNYPVEFYITVIKPTMLIGLLSSGLFYSKKILPNINTYTYDSWYNNYTLKYLRGVHPELGPLRELFFNNYAKEFRKVLPRNIDTDFLSEKDEFKYVNKLSTF